MNLSLSISGFLKSFISHIYQVLNSAYGYFLLFITFVLNLLQPEWFTFAVVGGGILIDFIFGMWAALKSHKFILSAAGRQTFTKIAGYSVALLGVFFIERIFHESAFIGVKIASGLAASCELWSILGSILIINPNLPFPKILRLQLKGEIENKIGRNLDNILKDNHNGNN